MIDERGYPWPPGAIEWARDRARLVFGVTLSEEQAVTLCELCYVQDMELDTALIALGACGDSAWASAHGCWSWRTRR
jgi:hypothetical protein